MSKYNKCIERMNENKCVTFVKVNDIISVFMLYPSVPERITFTSRPSMCLTGPVSSHN